MNLDALKVNMERVSGGKAIKVCDYDSYRYLFVFDGPNPFYLVNKEDGNSISINPLMDFDSFSDALENRIINTW